MNPGAAELPYDGVDNDCDAATVDDDVDGDGYGIATDCGDDDAAVSPSAEEVARNGVDDDCDEGTCQGDGFDTTATMWPIPTRYTAGSGTAGFEATAQTGWCSYGALDATYTTLDIDSDGLLDLVETAHCELDDVGHSEWWVYPGACNL